ncbi:prepilin-type N-terminal cleavage/methylation domain-containing protein [Candidatus Saccharibacteria bacterium]|nr:prepilin-type N-terminal cleavage/methylation domain-containing protein [Candidatus Saccharibacteria bacterium]
MNYSQRSFTQRGFTIVELLIVIVVIAILAAITIIAYNGIQERARVASATAFASQLKKKHLLSADGVWSFDECSGTTAANNASSQITSNIVGTLEWSSNTPTGSGCAGQFNGSTRIRTNATLGENYYLKAAWINLTRCDANNNIISSPDTGGQDSPFYIPTSPASNCQPRIFAGHNGSYGRISSSETLKLNTWYHVAVEFDNGTYSLFLDGKKIRESTGHPALNPVESGVNIGAHRTASNFNGLIDDVIIVGKKEQ